MVNTLEIINLKETKMLQVYYNESDWVIAESTEDAVKAWEETVGESWESYADGGETFELNNREIWRVSFESKEDAAEFAPPNAEITHDGNAGYWQARATQKQWIEKIGRGWFCSENW